LKSLINVGFGKRQELPVSFIPQKNMSVDCRKINQQKCVSIFRYSDWLFFNESVMFEQQRIWDKHCIEDRQG